MIYIKGERGVGKSGVIKAIFLYLVFWKRWKKLLIAASTSNAVANIGAIINAALSIQNCVPKQ